MGMFDTIQFEFEIPGRGAMHEWQTKSLDCLMDNYLVTMDYQLYRDEWKYEWVRDDSLALKGYMKRNPDSHQRMHLTDYHGDIIFYDDCSSCEYTARFSYGKMDNITFKTRRRLNDSEELLYECTAIRKQNSCPRGKEWQERCTQAGISPNLVYQVEKRK